MPWQIESPTSVTGIQAGFVVLRNEEGLAMTIPGSDEPAFILMPVDKAEPLVTWLNSIPIPQEGPWKTEVEPAVRKVRESKAEKPRQ